MQGFGLKLGGRGSWSRGGGGVLALYFTVLLYLTFIHVHVIFVSTVNYGQDDIMQEHRIERQLALAKQHPNDVRELFCVCV